MIQNQSVLFRLSYRQVLRNHTPEYKKILNESPLLQSAGTEKPHTWIQNDSEPIGTVSFNLQVLQSLTPEYTIILNESLLLQPAGTEKPHIWVQNDSERIGTVSFNLQVLQNVTPNIQWFSTNRYCFNLQVLKTHTSEYRMILNESPLLHLTFSYCETTHLGT